MFWIKYRPRLAKNEEFYPRKKGANYHPIIIEKYYLHYLHYLHQIVFRAKNWHKIGGGFPVYCVRYPHHNQKPPLYLDMMRPPTLLLVEIP
jgi:hypothetical protein